MFTSAKLRVMCCALAFVLVMAACQHGSSSRGSSGNADRKADRNADGKLTIEEAVKYAYDAGFRTEARLVDIVAIAVSESSLQVHGRRWHPEYGFRPASAVIGVRGPANVWNANRTRQLHSDRGVWQISSRAWPQYSDAQTDNPATAARLAWIISKHGQDLRAWDVYKSGAAQKHRTMAYDGWPAIQPIVHSFLASR